MAGVPVSSALSRRRLLGLLAGAATGLAGTAWPLRLPAQTTRVEPIDAVLIDPTLEAFADTLIPGQKRSPEDRAIAGAGTGPGAVEAGAVALLHFEGLGIGPAVPGIAAGLSARALAYAGEQGITLDPGVAPWVSLDFGQRTRLAIELLDGRDPDRVAWEAIGAIVFLAFHTAGHLDTAAAIRSGHPGLVSIGFPQPDADGLWRFPEHSYGRVLAELHPGTTPGGHPE